MTSGLWSLLRPYSRRLGSAMGLQALAGLCSLLPLALIAWHAQAIAVAAPERPVDRLVLAVVLATLLGWLLCQTLAMHIAHTVDADICCDIRQRLLGHMARLRLDWFAREGRDGTARLVEQDVRALHQLIAHAPNDLSNLVVVPLASMIWLAWLQPWLLIFSLVPLTAAAGGYAMLRTSRYAALFVDRNDALETLCRRYGEFADNLILARQYPGAGMQQSVQEAAAGYRNAFSRWEGRIGRLGAIIQLLLGTPWLAGWVLAGAALAAMAGAPLLLGKLCAFLLLLRAMTAPVQALGHGGDALLAARAAAARIGAALALPAMVDGEATGSPADGTVRVRGLAFAHGDTAILEDIDMDVAAGSLVALVGPSGAGKSTLLHLLARHMDVRLGSIDVGGVALRDLPEAVRNRHIVLVPQKASALDISLADNIALLASDVSRDAIRAAARAACLDDRIMELPQGYDSVPGRDLRLSGGELQRLALARALLSPAAIMLLDEPFSATDPHTAQILHEALRTRAAGRTRLITAHRLSEIVHADRILVLEAGRIVERGRHKDLLAAHGLYSQLWNEQNKRAIAA